VISLVAKSVISLVAEGRIGSTLMIVWDVIVRSGYTAQVTIEKIYDIYGQASVHVRHDQKDEAR
jgi:hypothetical protein